MKLLAYAGRTIKLGGGVLAKFHFVEDYEAHVKELVRTHPLDEAMSLAVGGNYTAIGEIESSILVWAGLSDNDAVLDFGCGSGRLAVSLSKRFPDLSYYGLDIIIDLIDYARTKCPANYKFDVNLGYSLPVPTSTYDFVSSFSVFTHLLHSETYLYLEEMHRCLKPNGKLAASFLEFANESHWGVFADTVHRQRLSETPHLNQFIERSQFTKWAQSLGFADCQFVDGGAAPWPSQVPLGQSVVILTK